MEYLHSMVRVSDLEKSLQFYCERLGLVEVNRMESQQGQFTLVFLAAPGDIELYKDRKAPTLELTYNWPQKGDKRSVEDYGNARNFGHLAYRVDNIYELCQSLMDGGATIHRPPRDGHMAFIKSPDNISIELLQKGPSLPPAEPWASMKSQGSW